MVWIGRAEVERFDVQNIGGGLLNFEMGLDHSLELDLSNELGISK